MAICRHGAKRSSCCQSQSPQEIFAHWRRRIGKSLPQGGIRPSGNVFCHRPGGRGLFLHSRPTEQNRTTMSAGIRGVWYQARVTRRRINVELYMDFGPRDRHLTQSAFRVLLSQKATIERELGVGLQWSSSSPYTHARLVGWRVTEQGRNSPDHTWPDLCSKYWMPSADSVRHWHPPSRISVDARRSQRQTCGGCHNAFSPPLDIIPAQ